MGVNLICCLNRTNVLNSDVKVLEDSTANYQISTELALKNIKSLNDLSQAFNFIISGEYYLLLFKITNVYTLIDKIISELNCDDIFTLIEKFVNWINNSESVENKIINEMKLNVEYGTKRLITEIHGFHSQNKIKLPKIYLIKCLTNLSLIAQYIKYINNNEKEKDYKENYWKEDDEKKIKLLSYKVSYNLMKIRDFLLNSSNHNDNKENTDSLKSNNEKLDSSKNEYLNLYGNIEKFIKELNDKFIN
jgi:hypothetical protein